LAHPYYTCPDALSEALERLEFRDNEIFFINPCQMMFSIVYTLAETYMAEIIMNGRVVATMDWTENYETLVKCMGTMTPEETR
jgi:hypothetical protein